jgi:hypothetical protein
LTAVKHKLSRDNRELMEENDRLVSRIEKLMAVFGTNLDSELSKLSSTSTSGQSLGPQPSTSQSPSTNITPFRSTVSSTVREPNVPNTNTSQTTPEPKSQTTVHSGIKRPGISVNPSSLINNTRLYLLTHRNSGAQPNSATTPTEPSSEYTAQPVPTLDFAKKKIEQNEVEVVRSPRLHTKDQLRKDLDRLDQEILALNHSKK